MTFDAKPRPSRRVRTESSPFRWGGPALSVRGQSPLCVDRRLRDKPGSLVGRYHSQAIVAKSLLCVEPSRSLVGHLRSTNA